MADRCQLPVKLEKAHEGLGSFLTEVNVLIGSTCSKPYPTTMFQTFQSDYCFYKKTNMLKESQNHQPWSSSFKHDISFHMLPWATSHMQSLKSVTFLSVLPLYHMFSCYLSRIWELHPCNHSGETAAAKTPNTSLIVPVERIGNSNHAEK